jgi:tetratricopeptide (TPR) repeat protein
VRGLKAASREFGDNPDVLATIADMFLEVGESSAASRIIEQLRTVRKASLALAYLEGRLLVEQGNWPAAIRAFSDLRGRMGPIRALSKRVYYYLGLSQEQVGSLENARHSYSLAADEERTWPLPHLGLARVALQRGEPRLALEEYRLLGRLPEARLATARLVLALNLRAPQRNWAEVDSALAAAAEVLPGSPDLVLLRVQRLAGEGRLQEALDLCESVRSAVPVAAAQAGVGVLRTCNGDAASTRRVEKWVKGIVEGRRTATALVLLADLRDYQRRYREAVALDREVLQANPHHLVALNNLAWLLAMTDDAKEAMPVIDHALTLARSTAVVFDTRAVVLLRLKKNDEALKDVKLALALAPTAESYFHLAQAEFQSGHSKAARDAWRKAQTLGLQCEALHPLEQPGYRELKEALDRP